MEAIAESRRVMGWVRLAETAVQKELEQEWMSRAWMVAYVLCEGRQRTAGLCV